MRGGKRVGLWRNSLQSFQHSCHSLHFLSTVFLPLHQRSKTSSPITVYAADKQTAAIHPLLPAAVWQRQAPFYPAFLLRWHATAGRDVFLLFPKSTAPAAI